MGISIWGMDMLDPGPSPGIPERKRSYPWMVIFGDQDRLNRPMSGFVPRCLLDFPNEQLPVSVSKFVRCLNVQTHMIKRATPSEIDSQGYVIFHGSINGSPGTARTKTVRPPFAGPVPRAISVIHEIFLHYPLTLTIYG